MKTVVLAARSGTQRGDSGVQKAARVLLKFASRSDHESRQTPGYG